MYFSSKKLKKLILKINSCNTLNNLEDLRIKCLGKKGYIKDLEKKMKILSILEKKKFGKFLNFFKKKILKSINLKKNELNNKKFDKLNRISNIDVSVSMTSDFKKGSIHIITKTINKMTSFFENLGFSIFTGPEIEHEYYNFTALNILKYHPSRNLKDTFWINNTNLLRTQTSSMQVRVMEKFSPPIRMIVPGKVYRKDSSSKHSPMFHQLEGLVIDKSLSVSNLKWLIFQFLENFFKKKVKIRFRNSYFPFTVPSFEIDILDKNRRWLEILGCGMVHPKVLKNLNINKSKYSAFAFGLGIERMIMIKYDLSNINLFFKNYLNFLKQF